VRTQTPRRAVDQSHAEAPFQLRKPLADRGRRHAQLARGSREIPVPRHKREQIQVQETIHFNAPHGSPIHSWG